VEELESTLTPLVPPLPLRIEERRGGGLAIKFILSEPSPFPELNGRGRAERGEDVV